MANEQAGRENKGDGSGGHDSQHHADRIDALVVDVDSGVSHKFSAPENTIVVTPSPEPKPERGSGSGEGSTERGGRDG